jgi:hypothetical protein
MTSREEDPEADREPTGILSRLERLAAEYRALQVDDPRGADEIIGYDANGLPG